MKKKSWIKMNKKIRTKKFEFFSLRWIYFLFVLVYTDTFFKYLYRRVRNRLNSFVVNATELYEDNYNDLRLTSDVFDLFEASAQAMGGIAFAYISIFLHIHMYIYFVSFFLFSLPSSLFGMDVATKFFG